LIDSPFSNAANIARALRHAGASLLVTSDPIAIRGASKVVLPGVGSFAAAMQWLVSTGIDSALRGAVSSGTSLLGICVGHQLLFEMSEETNVIPSEVTGGLGLLRGQVRRFDGPLPVPQIGWNRVAARGPLFDGIVSGTAFYFVNSYAARNAEAEIATADYNGAFTAAVQQDRVFGVQFHPEKSSSAGLRVLRNFVACN
jgi:imidazole glycerol-phosphate synthase subunit HisH